MAINTENGNIIFSFGAIADIQYADIEDRQNFSQTKWRHYRHSLQALKRAVNYWASQESTKPVSFILQLGDIIDGYNSLSNSSQEALDTVLSEFKKYQGDVHHVWGNHDLYNFYRHDLMHSYLNSSPFKQHLPQEDVKAYYEFSPHEKFCFIMLDTYEIGVLGYQKDHPIYTESEAMLASINPNENKNSMIGMVGMKQRFVSFNGGLGEEQLQWLDKTLAKAQQENKWAIISGSYHSCFN